MLAKLVASAVRDWRSDDPRPVMKEVLTMDWIWEILRYVAAGAAPA